MEIKKNTYLGLLSILIIFIISRFVIFNVLEIKPSDTISQYWQLYHLDLLYNDLIGTLIYSHSQPILWNLIVGLFLKVSSGNESQAVKLILFSNYFLSLLIFYYSFLILENFKFSFRQRVLCVILLSLYPGIIFYENLIFYSHLTCFIIFQSFYFFLKLLNTEKYKYEIFIYINFLILGYIWTAFHPIILVLLFLIINFIIRKKPSLNNLLVFLFIFFLSITPFIKNKILFGISSSGWTGFYLCQTIVFKANIPECAHNESSSTELHQEEFFKKYKKNKEDLNHPNLNRGPISKRHNLGFIVASDELLKKTKEFIINNPEKYLAQRIHAILASHGKFSFDYGIRPQNWVKNFSFQSKMEGNHKLKFIRQIVVSIIMFIIYSNIIFFLFGKNNDFKQKKAVGILAILYLYFYFLSIATNGHEHERIMYTWILINFLSLSLILKKIFRF
ncbi:hypothetical protein OA337_00480 [Candidatus Pelagibacter sp.]|nr:hypothetical protein [Candidatus Pelagibacter sp.]